MSQLTLRFSVVERNERGQEVELVRKALQFKPQVNVLHFLSKYFCLYFVQCGARPRLHDLKQSVGTKSYNQMLSYLLFDLSRAKSSKMNSTWKLQYSSVPIQTLIHILFHTNILQYSSRCITPKCQIMFCCFYNYYCCFVGCRVMNLGSLHRKYWRNIKCMESI